MRHGGTHDPAPPLQKAAIVAPRDPRAGAAETCALAPAMAESKMSLMLGKLYAALKSAGVPDDEAVAAAEEVAGFEIVSRPSNPASIFFNG